MYIRIIISIGLALIVSSLKSQLRDFEDGYIGKNWIGDTTHFKVNEEKQLQLNQEDAGSSFLTTDLNLSTNLEWEFFIRLAFSPSSNNYVRIYLMSDQLDLSDSPNGYYVQLGESGSQDGIDLFRQDGLSTTKLIDGMPGHASKSNNLLRIKVTKDQDGLWLLYSDTIGGRSFLAEGSATDLTYLNLPYAGFYFQYTKSNSDRIYLDDFYSGPVRIDTAPPLLDSIIIPNTKRLQLLFSEDIDPGTDQNNFLVGSDIGLPHSVSITGNMAQLYFNNSFTLNEIHSLSILNVGDLAGNSFSGDTSFIIYDVRPGDIIINEILFDPFPDGEDFVELYNNSHHPIDLQHLYLANLDTDGQLKTIVRISENPHNLKPGNFVVSTTDSSSQLTFYPTAINFLLLPSMPTYPNNEGSVLLIDTANQTIDRIDYTDDMHFELLVDEEGVSLERINPALLGSDKNSWHSASEASGFATPGYINSQFKDLSEVSDGVNLSPDIFSPNNDGHHDILSIEYSFNTPGQTANLRIFNSEGSQLIHLINNELLGTAGSFIWDGTDENGNIPSTGVYIILLETFDQQGNVSRFKKTCTLVKG